MGLVAAKTKSGEAIHAREQTFNSRTLCGAKAAHCTDLDVLITDRGIEHPWRCDKCHHAIVARFRVERSKAIARDKASR